jgi:D-glycero-alpha-D-manno-heptose 1-phosphate guanylyltransferase
MANLENSTAAILAGGLGTRLRSVVNDRPKVMAEVGGRPFLTYLLDQLVEAGVRRVVLCTGYRAEYVRDVFGDDYAGDKCANAQAGLRLVYSEETAELGTGGALRLAHPLLQSNTVLVLNGDSCCRADLGAFALSHRARGAEASVLLSLVEDARRFGRTQSDGLGRVLSFSEKTAEPGPGWINAGIYLLDTRLLAAIPADRPVSLEREMFPLWTRRRFFGYQTRAPFLDIGTPESYARAESFFRHLDEPASPLEAAAMVAAPPASVSRKEKQG